MCVRYRGGAQAGRLQAFALPCRSRAGGESPVRRRNQRRSLLRQPGGAEDGEHPGTAVRGRCDRQPRRGASHARSRRPSYDCGGHCERRWNLPALAVYRTAGSTGTPIEERKSIRKGIVNCHWLFSVSHVSFGGVAPGALALSLALVLPAPTFAQSYPSRTIRYLVGYTPAGTADMLARAVGARSEERRV